MDQLAPLNERITALIGNLSGLRPLYNEVGNFLVSVIQRNFIEQGRPERWKPSKAAVAREGQTLRDTGVLMNSIIAEPTDSGVDVGPSGPAAKYARILGEGGVITAKNKPYLMFSVMSGYRKTNKSGAPLRRPIAEYGFVRVKSVTIPGWNYMYVPPADQEKIAEMAAAFIGGKL